ncbi:MULTISPECIES: TetR/AcrR family transcriptional regulator [Kribbella]|uniref:TetR family transcriptional regulator n=1 Tax=Kribbella pratensis TaxID=2512112 RepID=A0ABY2FN07_9ACTN|nr:MULTISPECIES: TetR/AcrR family transcriptional regulator [Kribbella]TDW94532.1 TetR family transcriptional regulator [Kribbella pratensis]TDX03122.1 TetR family transcriptional regulator [Kribbella sp. VKM Ac-2566]
MEKVDGRLARGDQTRRAVLRRAVDIASVDGLEGLSIGRLATELGISKSGLFAHFGSKEELQLATVRAARRIYADNVVIPAYEVEPGLGRVWALSRHWLDYSRSRVFPGGCFFQKVSHEFSARGGAVHEYLASVHHEWMDLIETAVAEAVERGELAADPAQLAFDLNAYYEAANLASILHNDETGYERARQAVRIRLESAVVPGTPVPW